MSDELDKIEAKIEAIAEYLNAEFTRVTHDGKWMKLRKKEKDDN